ncbi:hypothetical protein PI125_g5134 [Phytophthora idaei]|nr:hypothetical protein PI125_g5134 [Phytophthora idaei]
MRTTFTFDDDKQLVQLAWTYIEAGSRIAWKDVARRMRPTGHTAAALYQRLQSLFRTWGKDISPFPAKFFTVVQRPCGRPPAVTQQLRSLAANPPPRQSNRAGAAEPPSAARCAPAPPRPSPSGAASAPAARQNPAPPRPRPGGSAAAPAAHQSPAPPLRPSPAPATRQGPAPPNPSPAGASSVLSSSNAEQAVASMFADVSRAAIAHPGDSPHMNVGEVLPLGVTALLREIGDVDASDVFFDIGAGLGNVIAQFVLATRVSKAIGLEVRANVYKVGMEMIAKRSHGQHIQERAEFYCNDVTGLCFSRLPPYKQATIVFWNNILFEPVTMEYVKRELGEMIQARLVVCTAPLCPRHRELCFDEFCSSFELYTESNIVCSWKAEPQRAYFYRSFQSY